MKTWHVKTYSTLTMWGMTLIGIIIKKSLEGSLGAFICGMFFILGAFNTFMDAGDIREKQQENSEDNEVNKILEEAGYGGMRK